MGRRCAEHNYCRIPETNAVNACAWAGSEYTVTNEAVPELHSSFIGGIAQNYGLTAWPRSKEAIRTTSKTRTTDNTQIY